MLEKLIDDFKTRAGTQLRLTSLAAVAAVAGVIAFAFLCAAGFVYVYREFGALEACLAGAGAFFLLMILIGGYAMAQRAAAEQRAELARREAKEKEKPLLQTALSDPLVLAMGLHIARTVGLRRLVPLVALSGIALGLWAGAALKREGRTSKKNSTSSEA